MNSKLLTNFVLFQIAWFACVMGAANHMPWLGVVVTSGVVAWRLFQAIHAQVEAYLILIAMLIGALFDQLMATTSLVHYVNDGWGNLSQGVALVPVWIIALWAAFATALNVSLRWMRDRPVVAILFGAIGGPLAYFAAEKLNAVTLSGFPSVIALALGWAVITPLLLKLSSHFDGR